MHKFYCDGKPIGNVTPISLPKEEEVASAPVDLDMRALALGDPEPKLYEQYMKETSEPKRQQLRELAERIKEVECKEQARFLLELGMFLLQMQEFPLTELEKFLNIMNFVELHGKEGLTHKEMAKIGITIDKTMLESMVKHGILKRKRTKSNNATEFYLYSLNRR